MKISPVASTQNVVTDIGGIGGPPSSHVEKMRTMKMSVNRTPEGRVDPYLQQQGYAAPAAPEQKLPISQSNEAQTAAEAIQPLSPQLALLAKERRNLQVMKRELDEREKAFKAQAQGSASGIDLARLKSQPLSVLLENGVTYDQLTEEILGGQAQENAKYAALEAKHAALEQSIEKRFLDQKEQGVKEYLARRQAEATQLVASDDSFELVREWGYVPKAIDFMKAVYDREGIEIPLKEALQAVEDDLSEELTGITKLKKAQSLFAPQTPPPVQRPQGTQRMTLKNTDTAAVPLTRRERALAAAYGTLKR